MALSSSYSDPNTLDLVFDQYLTQPIWEGLVSDLLWIGGTTGGLHAGSSAQVGSLQQLWLENLGAGGSRWVADVGNTTGSAQNELFIGRFHTGASDGWSGTALQPSLILYNDLSDIRTIFTDKTGTFKFSVSPTNNAVDPGHPWLRTDGTNLYLNGHGAGDLYLQADAGNHVIVQKQLIVDNGNTNGGSQDILFGAGSEGIGSKRTAGGNQNGLDFYIGGISRAALDSSGVLTSNGFPVATATTGGGTRIDEFFDSGTSSLGQSAHVDKTFTFGRAFSQKPFVAGSCDTTGSTINSQTGVLVSVSTTQAVVRFTNADGNPQTLSNFNIVAIGK